MSPRTDAYGKPYALLSETKKGDILIADDGFWSSTRSGKDIHCIKPNRKCIVKEDKNSFYVSCIHRKHFLDGQLDEDNDSLIGFYPFSKE